MHPEPHNFKHLSSPDFQCLHAPHFRSALQHYYGDLHCSLIHQVQFYRPKEELQPEDGQSAHADDEVLPSCDPDHNDAFDYSEYQLEEPVCPPRYEDRWQSALSNSYPLVLPEAGAFPQEAATCPTHSHHTPSLSTSRIADMKCIPMLILFTYIYIGCITSRTYKCNIA